MEVRTLSKLESQVILSLESESREELSLDDIERRTGVSRGHARKLAHRLAQKGWLQRLGGGRYLLNPARYGPDALSDTDALRIGSRLVRPYFFAYGTAAALHGWLSQMSPVYTLATTQRSHRRTVGPVEFRFIHVTPEKSFGLEERTMRGVRVWLSDREKTLLDCLDRPELAGGLPAMAEILYRARSELEFRRLWAHLRHYPSHGLANRLGFLMDALRPPTLMPRWFRARLRSHLTMKPVLLGRSGSHGRRGELSSTWRVLVNLPPSRLFGEVELG